MEDNHDIEKLIKKAEEPQKKAPKWHKHYRGKIESSLFIGDHVIYYISIGNFQLEVKTSDRQFTNASEVGVFLKRVILF